MPITFSLASRQRCFQKTFEAGIRCRSQTGSRFGNGMRQIESRFLQLMVAGIVWFLASLDDSTKGEANLSSGGACIVQDKQQRTATVAPC